ncbi:MAG: hypothetical protein LBR49_00220 [Tannerella sp.]|jgi:predicted membrane channel-forming protein YqfA (hemolysin III family)|nr:hypothetical protein [Tannerella sp.]
MNIKQKNKLKNSLCILFIIIGCVLACSTIIPNEYLKLAIVMVCLLGGLFGVFISFNDPENTDNIK